MSKFRIDVLANGSARVYQKDWWGGAWYYNTIFLTKEEAEEHVIQYPRAQRGRNVTKSYIYP